MPLSSSVFQLPIPPIFFCVPPSHPAQWVFRLVFLFYTLTVAIPLFLLLVPLSILTSLRAGHSKILPLHPDNLPPKISFAKAVRRGLVVYIIGTIIWAITGVGNAPETSTATSRRLTRWTCWFVELFTSMGEKGKLVYGEEVVQPLKDEYRLGVLQEGQAKDLVVFSLRHVVSHVGSAKGRTDATGHRKALLFLAGGGYVTGTPLAHPFVFSLTRRLAIGWTIYAPCIRKSLDRERSFPVPLLDALAAYQHLRRSYEAEDIVVMGDSAGGGLSWSLAAYLAMLSEQKLGSSTTSLDVPGGMILISPWLSLPPVQEAPYPDLVDVPQLLNAARCYMARYPILKDRPDPFNADWPVGAIALSESMGAIRRTLQRLLFHLPRRIRRKLKVAPTHPPVQSSKAIWSHGRQHTAYEDLGPSQWLDEAVFADLKSHHPLVSPATSLNDTFVRDVLDILAKMKARILIHSGSAEWFHDPAERFAYRAQSAGIDTTVHEEKGGFHVEGCVMPGEMGGAAGRLVEHILAWIKE